MEMLIALGWQKTMLGATLCFGREIYTEFGKLDKREVPVGMDHVFPFRGALLGGMYFIAEPLIYWRQHAMNAGDLVGDKSGLQSVYLETYLGYRVMRGLGMLRDVSHLIRRRGQKPELMAITQKLQMRLSNVIDDWVRKRNALYLEGLRPTWIEKAELEKRTINHNYRVWPDIETSDIPEPPRLRRAK
jgi:hypothetical protein